MSYCKDIEIVINVPVNLDSETISLYDSLSKSGYNLFDSNDSFYNDICTPYTTENNTDIILLDRKNILYKNNGDKQLCQNGCDMKDYGSKTKKAKCECSVEEEKKEINLDDVKLQFNKKETAQSFLTTLKNSNFLVLKCYKLVFNLDNISINKGLILMSIMLLIIIILIIFSI